MKRKTNRVHTDIFKIELKDRHSCPGCHLQCCANVKRIVLNVVRVVLLQYVLKF